MFTRPGKTRIFHADPQVKRLFCAFLVVFGLITAVAGTYLAVVDMG